MITIRLMLINISWQVLIATKVAGYGNVALTDMNVEKVASRELIHAASTLRRRLTLSLMPVDLPDWELVQTESAPGRPTTD